MRFGADWIWVPGRSLKRGEEVTMMESKPKNLSRTYLVGMLRKVEAGEASGEGEKGRFSTKGF